LEALLIVRHMFPIYFFHFLSLFIVLMVDSFIIYFNSITIFIILNLIIVGIVFDKITVVIVILGFPFYLWFLNDGFDLRFAFIFD
jgi:hypothetical protein